MAKKTNWLRCYVGEFIGTFVFLLGGFLAIAGTQLGFINTPDLVIPMAFGFSLMGMVFALGHTTGAHFNPAVTIGLAAGGHFPWKRAVPYILVQILGATLAALLLQCVFEGNSAFAGVGIASDFSSKLIWIFEAIGTFVLTFVITAIATDKRTDGIPNGLAIGGALFALALTIGWLSGGGFNPARSLAQVLIGGTMVDLAYLGAPVIGAIMAALSYNWVSKK